MLFVVSLDCYIRLLFVVSLVCYIAKFVSRAVVGTGDVVGVSIDCSAEQIRGVLMGDWGQTLGIINSYYPGRDNGINLVSDNYCMPSERYGYI